jgi:MFS family permease
MAKEESAQLEKVKQSISAPLRHGVFLRIWLASIASNIGIMIQGVGAAWAMTQLATTTDMVALVQTASFMPVMLLSLASGAFADMYDRRIVGIAALSISCIAAAALSVCAFLHLLTPTALLCFCFIIGTGAALLAPSWQASVSEQVPRAILPQAISLNSISFNMARSFGPAIGGALVASAGAVSAFVANALLYVPMIVALILWRRKRVTPRLPPESLGRAIISGMRYVIHSPVIRAVLVRTLVHGVIGGALSALMPLVARDLLGGGALTYGVLLGAFGMGAVIGALSMTALRGRFSTEQIVSASILVMGASVIAVARSSSLPISVAVLLLDGAAWMASASSFNIEMQLAAPRWVAGRNIASFQAAISGGVALGGILWGHVAQTHGVGATLFVSGIAMLASPLLAIRLRLPRANGPVETPREALADPEVVLGLTPRSGPIVIEIDYRIDPSDSRRFYEAIQEVRRTRQRNGAYSWSISRDIAEPEMWTERFQCPTWHDYLHQRSRATQAERDLQRGLRDFHKGSEPVRVRRMLERPFGSVRWREDTPDVGGDAPTHHPY